MAYCSEDDILRMLPQAELAELTAESGDIPDPEVVAAAINQAGAEIDSYLQVRYSLPLSPTPGLIKPLGVDLAIYHLYSRRGVMPPVRRQNYEAALSFLKAVAAGQAGLGEVAGEPSAEVSGAGRLFSRNELEDW